MYAYYRESVIPLHFFCHEARFLAVLGNYFSCVLNNMYWRGVIGMQYKAAYVRETTTTTDSDGNITKNEVEKTLYSEPEPDFIKLYTNTWCEFNKIPRAYRALFLQLALRMSYCDANDLDKSQLVFTGKPFSESIAKSLNWKGDMYKHGLVVLTKCGAIRRVSRGVYQINPSYAGKGSWKYNARLQSGGIKELRSTFDFINKKVDTEIVWADDGKDTKINEMYREGMGVTPDEQTVLKSTTITNVDTAPNNSGVPVTDNGSERVGA